jgi:hypothetical protein
MIWAGKVLGEGDIDRRIRTQVGDIEDALAPA